MKKQQLAEVKKTDNKELTNKIRQLKSEIQSLVLDKASGKLTDLKSISKKRRDLAQILTVFRQKQLLAEFEKGAKDAKNK